MKEVARYLITVNILTSLIIIGVLVSLTQSLAADYNMNSVNQTITCGAHTYYDDGGQSANHSQAIYLQTFAPDTYGKYLQFNFTAFALGVKNPSTYYVLIIYDGSTIYCPVIGIYFGTTGPGVVKASNAAGALTFQFTSVGSPGNNPDFGWEASVSCIEPDASYWDGSEGTAWDNANNWTPAGIPDSRTNVTIPAAASPQPVIPDNIKAYCRDLVIESGAILRYSSKTAGTSSFQISGNLTVDGALQRYNGANLYIQLTGGNAATYQTISGTGDMSEVPFQFGIRTSTGSNPIYPGYYRIMQNTRVLGICTEYGDLDMNDFHLNTYQCRVLNGILQQKTGTLGIEGDYDGTTTGSVYITDANFIEGTGTTYFNARTFAGWNSMTGDQMVPPGVTFYNLKVRGNDSYTCELGDGMTSSNVIVTNSFEIINPGADMTGGSWVRINTRKGNYISVGNDFIVNTNGSGLVRFVMPERVVRSSVGSEADFIMGNLSDTIVIYYGSTVAAAQKAFVNFGNNLNFKGTVVYDNSLCSTSPPAANYEYQYLIGMSYNNLIIRGSKSTNRPLTSDITVAGDLITANTSSTGYLDATTSNYNLTLAGNWINKKTAACFHPRNSTVTFNGSGTQWINVFELPSDWPNSYPPAYPDPFYFYNIIIDGSDVRLCVRNTIGMRADGDITINNGKEMMIICSYGGLNYAFKTYGNLINNGILDCRYNDYWFTMYNASPPGPNYITGTGTYEYVGFNLRGNINQTVSLNEFNCLKIDATYTYDLCASCDINLVKYSTAESYFENNGIINLNAASNFYITGTWINNGILNADNTSTVIFNGTAEQDVTPGSSITGDINPYGNITMNNTSATGIVLRNHLAVGNACTFQDGNIYTTDITKLLVFKSGSLVSDASDNSYTDGPVRKIGNTLFTFPTGDEGNYQAIEISAPADIADHFTAQYFKYSPDEDGYTRTSLAPGIDHVSNHEYWILNRTWGISDVAVKLGWDNNSGTVTDMAELIVSRWDGTKWGSHGNGGITGTAAVGTVISDGAVNSFSPFALATRTNVNQLPIELTAINGICLENSVLISWTTASEYECDKYIIEKSIDGVAYISAGEVPVAGNSNQELMYTYIDIEPASGEQYYRLIQKDINGMTVVLKNLVIECNTTADDFLVFPNPVQAGSKVFLIPADLVPERMYTCIIYNNIGNTVHTQSIFPGENGMLEGTLDIPAKTSQGLYLMSIQSESDTYFKTIIIE
ncbi:MAG: hypothetical protein KJ607_03130 [Bacteroidetes bacterium]|nr:hypothetical protein [Bacteroidota bacterium]